MAIVSRGELKSIPTGIGDKDHIHQDTDNDPINVGTVVIFHLSSVDVSTVS